MTEFTFPVTITASTENEAVSILTELLGLAEHIRPETIAALGRLAKSEPLTLDQLGWVLANDPATVETAKKFLGIA